MYFTDRRRLIDMYLTYLGYCNRQDLISQIDIGTATASRDFQTYKAAYPKNLLLNQNKKRYEATPEFTAAYEHDIPSVLTFLTTETWPIEHKNPGFGCQHQFSLPHGMNQNYVSAITRAIANHRAVDVSYCSANSGTTHRRIHPHAIMTNGLYWYTRAYDEDKREFRNFRLSRLLETKDALDAPYIGQESDRSWVHLVTITIAPHPNHQNTKAFLSDLGLEGKPLINIRTSEAMTGFLLSSLRVDCSESQKMDHNQFPFVLLNRHELVDISSMVIAPGFMTQ
ncbi:WYL domain-containing protein [Kistimonas scapharcae]|uniref:helix-turn-helix transcriptional regulator n=1 Tax=Kistimonas scapharcae TaxID=1036133 RepID=UPI0031EACC3A